MALEGIEFTFRKNKPQLEYQPREKAIDKTIATVIVALDGTGDFDNIQAAINSLPSGGGVVYIKEGTYNISSPITLKSKTTLRGAGRGTIVQSTTGIGVSDTLFDLSSLTEARISEMNIKKGSASPAYAVKFSASSRCVLEGCWFDDFTSEGLIYLVGGSSENRIINNKLSAADLAVWIGETGTGNDKNIIIGNTTDTGIRITEGSSNIIIGNIVTAGELGADSATPADTIIAGNIKAGPAISASGTRTRIWGNSGENIFTATSSTGVGTIKFTDATNRDSAGFLKYVHGTTTYYIPVFSAI